MTGASRRAAALRAGTDFFRVSRPFLHMMPGMRVSLVVLLVVAFVAAAVPSGVCHRLALPSPPSAGCSAQSAQPALAADSPALRMPHSCAVFFHAMVAAPPAPRSAAEAITPAISHSPSHENFLVLRI